MEALLATPVGTIELLAGKFIPYFLLGMITMALATGTAVFLFGVPFRGSFIVLALVSGIFLTTALAQGLLISTIARNQLVAAEVLRHQRVGGKVVLEIDDHGGFPWGLPLSRQQC